MHAIAVARRLRSSRVEFATFYFIKSFSVATAKESGPNIRRRVPMIVPLFLLLKGDNEVPEIKF